MDQRKTGLFLKELRKAKGLTQEQLAEQFGVSNRTVSRWETGSNMPDLGILVELSDFYQVDIREIIDGERKSENMNEEMKATLTKVAEYGDTDKRMQYLKMRKLIGYILLGFGIFVIVSAMAVFPGDSSWGAIYSVIGCIVLGAGAYQTAGRHGKRRARRVMISIGTFVLAMIMLIVIDYVGVVAMNQVPRFAYEKSWGEDEIVYEAPFYTVVRHNYDTEREYIEVIY